MYWPIIVADTKTVFIKCHVLMHQSYIFGLTHDLRNMFNSYSAFNIKREHLFYLSHVLRKEKSFCISNEESVYSAQGFTIL